MAYKWCRLAAAVAILTGLFVLVQFHRYDDHTQPATLFSGLTKPVLSEDEVDWSTFAYTQYVTNSAYLCNSVMFFEALHRLLSRADRVMMYPSEMLQSSDDSSSDARLLIRARDEYNVKLVPIAVQYGHGVDQSSSRDDYDMEIVNYLYRDSALIIPHRRYDMLTGEFRHDDHVMYLGSDREVWDPIGVYNELKLIHFSDWPLPKPWLHTPENLIETMQPKCTNSTGSSTYDCASRNIWNSFYSDFKNKRKEVCTLGPL
ncbi:hypothetical protein QQZ08_010625 [Neonectria magnoliae]|uniref:Glucose N-acetyltransferase 1 n=1 Tax=Neonectria magnoliae TaxID=2732573 RepID=A0ABR1HFF6_9HYPO